jgi:single-strand DNA-binding protein
MFYFLLPISMFNVNRVTLLGNVTRDPEARSTKTGLPVTNIGFATSSRSKDEKGNVVSEPEYHHLVCFGQMGEFTAKSAKKGSPLYVEGRLHTSRFKNKKGEDSSRTEVIVDKLVLLSAKKGKVAVEAKE